MIPQYCSFHKLCQELLLGMIISSLAGTEKYNWLIILCQDAHKDSDHFYPKISLTEFVDSLNDQFYKNKINKWFSVNMSPKSGQYTMKLVPNSIETSAKSYVLVTIFAT